MQSTQNEIIVKKKEGIKDLYDILIPQTVTDAETEKVITFKKKITVSKNDVKRKIVACQKNLAFLQEQLSQINLI